MSWTIHTEINTWNTIGIGLIIATYIFILLRQNRLTKIFSSKIILCASSLFLVSLILISILILKPEIIFKYKNSRTPKLLVLRDVSASMDSVDISDKTNTISRRNWAMAFSEGAEIATLKNNYDVILKDFASKNDNGDDDYKNATDIGSALSQLLTEDFSEIILISDGCSTEGPSPVKKAAELALKGVRVHCVTTGSNEYMPDIELGEIQVPSYCILNERLSIPYIIHNKFERPLKTSLRFNVDDGHSEDLEVKLEENSTQNGIVSWKPLKSGKYKISLSLPPEKGESDILNNIFSSDIEVRQEKIKVLLIDSLPRWEFRYIKNALSRDSGIEATFMLFLAEQKMGEGKGYRTKFPTKDELASFDVIFLGDIGCDEISKDEMESLKNAVANNASGLVLIPGRRAAFTSLENSPLKDLIPIVCDPKESHGTNNYHETAIELTSYGASHHLTMLEDSPSANSALWKNLPGFNWNWTVLETRPGARTIAVHASARNNEGKMPIIVERAYGSGLVLFMGSDHVWKWRKGVEDKYHYRFWGQVIRWMSHKRYISKNENARIFHEPENPIKGRETTVNVFISEKFPADFKELSLHIQSEKDGTTESLVLHKDPREKKHFSGSFVPRKIGKQKMIVSDAAFGEIAQVSYEVRADKREKTGEPANVATMKAIAKAGDGFYANHDATKQMISEISGNRRDIIEEKRLLLWNNPYVILSIVLLISTTWILKKVVGI